ncbi:hypothetical protein SAMN05880574_10381 [Chryseobacterium sp. RU37D]|uniref:hypothetical protein n=1 Tax=Chryseobacterium sp. RU37D TaxID=1907397 RepID=UPI00095698CD|nr:hypothetical protein [Chryseobacterium sp. RU37D]SIP97465.1 hypothetical protein SAMN05880574_10381 [Chryseobacterium sp. RU37D]
MNESALSKKQIDDLYSKRKSISNQPTNFSKSTDQKYRTMRLAMSVTGEYTQFHGGLLRSLANVSPTVSNDLIKVVMLLPLKIKGKIYLNLSLLKNKGFYKC